MTRRFVGGISRDMLRTTFRDWFGVQDNHADLLVTLFQAQGQPIAAKALAVASSSHRPGRVEQVWERVRNLRQVLNSEAIDTFESGYGLTDIGMAECHRALRETARVLAAESALLPHIPGLYEIELGRDAEVGCTCRTMAA